MIQLPHIKARVVRLDELTRALCKEIVVIRDAQDPLLYLERRRYLDALHRAVGQLETARVVLAWRGEEAEDGPPSKIRVR